MTDDEDAIALLHRSLECGDHWYIAMLKAMSRWTLPEETLGERSYRYLVGGEAFDWLVLAERLLDEIDGLVPDEEREELLFNGHPPIEVDEEEFQDLIGTPKYQAYLNYLYGVTVEEALQFAVEEEVAKERMGQIFAAELLQESAFQRIYGRPQKDLLREFQKERGLDEVDGLLLNDFKEFTYWLFKYRVRWTDGARVASDTRKGLVVLSQIEASNRSRSTLEKVTSNSRK